MNVIISFAGDDYYPIPTNITELYFDFDWVRVWKTGAPSQVVLPTGINSAFNGYLPLPASSPWNTNITNYPVDTNSTAILTKSDLSTNLRCEALAGPYNGISGMQYITVPANQPLKTVVFDGYRTDTVSWPIPDNAPVEGYEDTGYQDRHVMVLQLDPTKPNGMGKLYELFAARPQGSYPTGTTSWLASFGIIWDMNANEVLAAQQTSADAAGLPILPGVLRYDEVASGEIKHALRFTLAPGYTRKSYVLPASHHAGFGTTSEYAPFGMRVRLKASVPETGYPAEVQTIMRCLKKYGMFMADNGGNWFISGTMDSRWNVDNLVWLGYLHPSDFEVLQMGTIFSY